jgi:DNA-binding CsgD family transcriptional regulator
VELWSGFVAAHSDAFEFLQFAKEILDQVPPFVHFLIDFEGLGLRDGNLGTRCFNDWEVETLTWVARGKTPVEIAKIIQLPKRTVDFHINNARNKLRVSTRTEAAIKALTAGWSTLEDEPT